MVFYVQVNQKLIYILILNLFLFMIIRTILISIPIIIFSWLWPLLVYANMPAAVLYLKNQTLDDWSAQALVAVGEPVEATPLQTFGGSSATDYAKRILSLVAVGKNPVGYTGVDLITGLKSFEQSGQLGDPALLNDDAWGIIALRSAGLPANDSIIKNSAQYLLDHQNADGGWSWGVGFDSDTNDTAAVLMALTEAGYDMSHTAIQAGVDYLATQQNPDAGWPYQLPCFWPGCEASDSASTSWVISALNKLNLEVAGWTKAGQSPQDFLLSLQTADGSFKWQASDPSGSAVMTSYALVALAGKSYPVVSGYYIGGQNTHPTPLADLDIKFLSSSLNLKAGEQFGLIVKLVNNGPTMAQGVAAELSWPEGIEVIQAQVSDGEFSVTSKKWTFIRFNNYAEAQLNLVMVARRELNSEIKISVKAQDLDFNLTNNEATVGLAVSAPAQPLMFESTPEPVVLGETSYSCEPAPTASAINWPGQIVSVGNSLTPWYVDPVTNQVYCLADAQAAYRALEIFGLGITNADLAKIPLAEGESITVEPAPVMDEDLTAGLKGRILLQVESVGEAWYVNPTDGRRYYLADGQQALHRFSGWRLTIEP